MKAGSAHGHGGQGAKVQVGAPRHVQVLQAQPGQPAAHYCTHECICGPCLQPLGVKGGKGGWGGEVQVGAPRLVQVLEALMGQPGGDKE